MNPESVVERWPRTFASCCSLLVAAACGGAASDEVAVPAGAVSALATSGAWARPADSGATTAVYFVLQNGGATVDTLTGVASDAAEATQLHISMQREGMMHMTEVPALPVPANDSVAFRPLGAHVMLTGLRRPLVAGDTVAVTLAFRSGASLEVRAGVRVP